MRRLIDRAHATWVYGRRLRVLARRLAPHLPRDADVLDVGCGDGRLARLLGEARPDLSFRGVEVLVRPDTLIPVERYDGRALPLADRSVDAALLVDMLHHTDDPLVLLREAARVARRCVVIKDHAMDGALAGPTLRLMDWVGNARHGVALPYNYWPERRWRSAFDALGWRVASWEDVLALYPIPARWVFDRSLHFIARIDLDGVTR